MSTAETSFEKHFLVKTTDQTAISFLSKELPKISKQKLKQTMRYGAVWITKSGKTNRIRRAKKPLNIGDELHLYYDEEILFGDVEPAKLIADEIEYSVWDKPCGMFSQGTKWGDHNSITRWVELFGLEENKIPQRPCFLVHRLDRATSGLILVAHSKKVASKLARLFENRQIEKRYTAIVNGCYPAEDKFQKLDSDIDGKSATSIILSSEYDLEKNQTSLLIKIESGRKHQIRKHLSGVGFPIIGDRLYGGIDDEDSLRPDLMLRSCFLEFVCPISGELKGYLAPLLGGATRTRLNVKT